MNTSPWDTPAADVSDSSENVIPDIETLRANLKEARKLAAEKCEFGRPKGHPSNVHMVFLD